MLKSALQRVYIKFGRCVPLAKEFNSVCGMWGMTHNDIEGIIVLIMVLASKDADANLKKMVLEISRNNGQKKQTTAKSQIPNKNETQDDIDEIQNLKLQMIIDRKSDMAREVNYAMKKISSTQQTIINDLK
jgi:hypothetical protein